MVDKKRLVDREDWTYRIWTTPVSSDTRLNYCIGIIYALTLTLKLIETGYSANAGNH